MLARVASEALSGLEGFAVEIEADVVAAAPAFTIVGLPDAAVQESRERVRAAIVNSAYEFPSRRITVNLAPADVRKEGPSFDLPIALAFLLATRQAQRGADGIAAVGELGLDGSLRPIVGALAVAESVSRRGLRGLVLPRANAAEAALVPGLKVYPADTLRAAVAVIEAGGGEAAQPCRAPPAGTGPTTRSTSPTWPVRSGQARPRGSCRGSAQRAHDWPSRVGQDHAGSSPANDPAAAHGAGSDRRHAHLQRGRPLPARQPLVVRRPFRAPHHSVSSAGLVGGGGTPRPGEVSLAHLGVLFLDEFPEFRLAALEGLRQPLEDGEVTISRALSSVTFPARLMLVAAMNPCPCGFLGDRERECACPAHRLRQYVSKLSGPLLDRIELRVEVPRRHAAASVAPSVRATSRRPCARGSPRRAGANLCASPARAPTPTGT